METGNYGYFGIDIGDGETAVSHAVEGSNAFPNVLDLQGEQSLLTAIAEARDGRHMIGSSARRAGAGVHSLRVRFKSEFLSNPQARVWMEQFARALREKIQAAGHMSDMSRVKIHIGCPSGWGDTTQEAYLSTMKSAGFANVTIAKESRAAMLYAREASELRLSMNQLQKPFLIIDSGSSTTDFTYVNQRSIKDWGEVALGGGIIDELLLAYNLEGGENEERAALLIARNPLLRASAELLARDVKELYFDAKRRGDDLTYPINKAEKIYTDPPVTVSVACDRAAMDHIISIPCERINGQSYSDYYRRALESKRDKLASPPETILLTGGACKMDFIRKITREVFPKAHVILGIAPEFSIAHGLCLMQRIQDHCERFRGEVNQVIHTKEVEKVVEHNFPALFPQLVPILTDQLLDDIVPRAFRAWKHGDIPTINDMIRAVETECRALTRNPETHDKLKPVIAQWLQTLRPELEKITTPICARHNIEPVRLVLPNFVDVKTGLPLDAKDIMNYGSFETVIAVVVSIVLGTLGGGSGIALIMSGPAGWAIGVLIGLVLVFIGSAATQKAVYSANLPKLVRSLVLEWLLTRRLNRDRQKIEHRMVDDLAKQLKEKNADFVKMLHDISAVIERQLLEQTEEALILLN